MDDTLTTREIETRNLGYPHKQKAKLAVIGPRPGIPIGYSYVLFPDGERRPVRFGNYEVYSPFRGADWTRIVKAQIWDQSRNERIEIEGYLRTTTDSDQLFVQYPPDAEFQLPDWSPSVVREAHGEVTDGMGYLDPSFGQETTVR